MRRVLEESRAVLVLQAGRNSDNRRNDGVRWQDAQRGLHGLPPPFKGKWPGDYMMVDEEMYSAALRPSDVYTHRVRAVGAL